MKKTRLLSVLATMSSAALVLAACSGTTDGAGGEATDTEIAACVEEATAGSEAGKADLELQAPPSEFDMSANDGKSVWLISASDSEFSKGIFEGFEAAAEAVGMSSHYAQADGEVTQMQKLVQQAVSTGANGIALLNVEPAAVSDALAQAVDAGITVIDINNGGPADPVTDGIFAHVGNDQVIDGNMEADWMLADSGCQLHIATFTLPTYTISTDLIGGIEDRVRDLCSWCEITSNDMDLATLATDFGPQSGTVLRRDPSINYMTPGYDSFIGFMDPVLQAQDAEVKLVGHSGNPANIAAMRSGETLEVMTAAGPPDPFTGWAAIDQLGRGMSDQDAVLWSIPVRLIDLSNVGDERTDLFPAYAGFEDSFLAAWGEGE